MKKFLIILALLIGIGTVYEVTRKEKVYSFSDTGLIYGNKDAPNRLVIFTSFQCEKCERFSKAVSGCIREMISSGDYCIIYKPVNRAFYQNDDCLNLKYDELETLYNKPSDSGSINKENEQVLSIIEDELEDNNLSVVPVYFYNGIKHSAIASSDEFKEVISEKQF